MSLTIQLLLLALLLLVISLVLSIRKRQKHHERLITRLLQHQKSGKTIAKTPLPTQNSTITAELNNLHRALADQITHAGETLDRKISILLSKVTSETEEPATKADMTSDSDSNHNDSPEKTNHYRDFLVLRKGLANDPARHLNLVHGIPKAGNTSLLASLWASHEIVGGAMSAHFLSAKAMDDIEETIRKTINPSYRAVYFRCLKTRKLLGDLGYLKNWTRPASAAAPSHPLMVICPFRDPVASALSYRFYVESIRPPGANKGSTDVLLRDASPVHPEGFLKWMVNWLEHELLGVHGIDLYQSSFDRDRGFSVIENDHTRVLVATLEAHKTLPEALGMLYQCDPTKFKLVKSNDAQSRSDAARYRETVDTFRLPEAMAERIYTSPVMKLLYSDAQRTAFVQKWTRP